MRSGAKKRTTKEVGLKRGELREVGQENKKPQITTEGEFDLFVRSKMNIASLSMQSQYIHQITESLSTNFRMRKWEDFRPKS